MSYDLQNVLPFVPVIALVLVIIGVSIWLVLRKTAQARALRRAIRAISSEYQSELVIPDGMDGEIQLQHMLLTSRGILVMDLKHANGAVFAGEKLDEWTVMEGPQRFKFNSPLAALRARTAAVRAVAKDVPVHGRVVFLGNAEFVGGRPEQVITLEELQQEFAQSTGRDAASISAFHSSWEQIQLAANH
ncbi:MAG: hypothetical protein HKN59_08470 [Gammaproteobacteria bacterium]|nr:hypothetical protein [Gammaproteobacteria bacterium]